MEPRTSIIDGVRFPATVIRVRMDEPSFFDYVEVIA